MTEYIFPTDTCFTPDDLHELIAAKLPLPACYGGNLDALYDVLTEPHPPWKLTFTGCKTASAVIGARYMRAFRKCCEDAAQESEGLTVVFTES